MRVNTRVFNAVVGDNPAIKIDPDLASKAKGRIGRGDVSVCARCFETTFGPVTWAHLRGDTLDPPIPDVDGDKSDYHIMDDLDFVAKMFNSGNSPKKRGPMVDFKIPMKEIVKSSEQSCGFCKLLVTLESKGPSPAKGNEIRVLRLQAFWPEKSNGILYPMMLEVGIHPDISGGGQAWPLAFTDERETAQKPSEDSRPSTAQSTWTPLLQQANEWLWRCEGSHNECSHSESQRSPTRLLDLTHLGQQRRVYLVDSADVADSRYAVLSYVWGTSNTLRLVQGTQTRFKGGIAADELPLTIQHAMLVANNLHIGYLWVDSLCILQDSETDKSHEIPRMNEYYRNALVVISASAAEDVHSGFLYHQLSRGDARARLQEPGPHMQRIIGPTPLRIPGHFRDYSTPLLVDAVPMMYHYEREPINKRAWTLQESVLPRRLLTFPMTGGLSMRCLEGEVLAGEIRSNPYNEVPDFGSLGIISLSGHTGTEKLELWNTMVEDYTRRSLTHRSDILVAIGALAREFHAKNATVMGRYLGGLWENHVRDGLLWYNGYLEPPPVPEPRAQEFAPSWSWASCPSRIVFVNKPEMFLPGGEFTDDAKWKSMFIPRWYCEVLSCEVTPRSELDPFGALKSGVLTVRGPLRPLQRHPADRDAKKGGGGGFIKSLKKKFKSAAKPPSDGSEHTTKTVGCPDLYLKEAAGAAEILILDRPPAATAPERSGSENQQYHWLGVWYAGRGRARGLIVRQLDETTFQRVGFAEYIVGESAFPSSEGQKERTIRLV